MQLIFPSSFFKVALNASLFLKKKKKKNFLSLGVVELNLHERAVYLHTAFYDILVIIRCDKSVIRAQICEKNKYARPTLSSDWTTKVETV